MEAIGSTWLYRPDRVTHASIPTASRTYQGGSCFSARGLRRLASRHIAPAATTLIGNGVPGTSVGMAIMMPMMRSGILV